MRFTRFLWLCLPLALGLAGPVQAQRFVCMESNQGNWCMELLSQAAPNTVSNFLQYVTNGDYDESLIHRSLPGTVLQGGAFNWYSDGLYYTNFYGFLPAENSGSHLRGTVGVIPLFDSPDSGASQWFINVQDNTDLDGPGYSGFTVFARIVSGMDVIDKINNFPLADLSEYFRDYTFSYVPVAGGAFSSRDDFVIINRTYATDFLPGTEPAAYHCSSPQADDALAELCGGEVTVPIDIIGQGFHEVTLQVVSTVPKVVVKIKPGSLTKMTTSPVSYGSYDPVGKVMTLPSVRTGTFVYNDLTLLLTDEVAQQFTVQSFRQ